MRTGRLNRFNHPVRGRIGRFTRGDQEIQALMARQAKRRIILRVCTEELVDTISRIASPDQLQFGIIDRTKLKRMVFNSKESICFLNTDRTTLKAEWSGYVITSRKL